MNSSRGWLYSDDVDGMSRARFAEETRAESCNRICDIGFRTNLINKVSCIIYDA